MVPHRKRSEPQARSPWMAGVLRPEWDSLTTAQRLVR